jgi:hypothetical protein
MKLNKNLFEKKVKTPKIQTKNVILNKQTFENNITTNKIHHEINFIHPNSNQLVNDASDLELEDDAQINHLEEFLDNHEDKESKKEHEPIINRDHELERKIKSVQHHKHKPNNDDKMSLSKNSTQNNTSTLSENNNYSSDNNFESASSGKYLLLNKQ